jgi:hypothetical protein
MMSGLGLRCHNNKHMVCEYFRIISIITGIAIFVFVAILAFLLCLCCPICVLAKMRSRRRGAVYRCELMRGVLFIERGWWWTFLVAK